MTNVECGSRSFQLADNAALRANSNKGPFDKGDRPDENVMSAHKDFVQFVRSSSNTAIPVTW